MFYIFTIPMDMAIDWVYLLCNVIETKLTRFELTIDEYYVTRIYWFNFHHCHVTKRDAIVFLFSDLLEKVYH